MEFFKKKKNQFDPAKLSEFLREQHVILTLEDNEEIYIYNNIKGVYESNGEKKLRAIIKTILGDEYKERHARAVIDDITASSYIKRQKFKIPEFLVPVKNGLLILSGDRPELIPHDPKYYVTQILPVTYDPKACCPHFLNFVCEILSEDSDRLKIQEGFGNCLTTSKDFMIIFFLYGEGANGKSTLLNVLEALLGEENYSCASLEQITYGRWFIAELYRKLANIFADIGIKALKKTGAIQILTGKDVCYGEKKFKNAFKFRNYAKPWFSGNKMPEIFDDSDGFHRRWIIIVFREQFLLGQSQTDNQILDKLITPEELSGVLNWAIEGYYRLRKQKEFTDMKSIEERRQQWHELSDSLSVFIVNCTEAGDSVSKDDFYFSYRTYCLTKGLPVMTKTLVGRKMKEKKYQDAYLGSGGQQKYCWKGIDVKPEYLFTPDDEFEQQKEAFCGEDVYMDDEGYE